MTATTTDIESRSGLTAVDVEDLVEAVLADIPPLTSAETSRLSHLLSN